MRLSPFVLLGLAAVAANCSVRTLDTVVTLDAGYSGGAGGAFNPGSGGNAGGFTGNGFATGGAPVVGSGGALGCSSSSSSRETIAQIEVLLDGNTEAAAPKFAPRFVGNGESPRVVQLADLTSDGKPDLVFQDGAQVRFRPGVGDGTFGFASNPVLTEENILSWTVADLNSDLLADLVLTPAVAGDAVIVHMNRGNGDMAPALYFGAQSTPTWLPAVVADFTGDGRADIALPGSEGTSESPFVVRLMVNGGVGTFRAAAEYPTTQGTTALLAGDADGDGKNDLLSLGPCATHDVLRADGADGFTPAAPFAGVGFGDLSIDRTASTFGDVNGDGRADLVTAYAGSDRVRILLSDGIGGFALSEQRFISGLGKVRLQDVNGDNKVDIVVGSQGQRTGLVVLLGSGDGHFSKPFSYITQAAVSDFAIADLNSDRKADIVLVGVGSPPESGITVLMNTSR